jgi:Tol biopolymer transport system component
VQNEVIRAERKEKPFFILLLSGDTWLSFEAVQYEDVHGGRLPSQKFYGSLANVISPTELPSPKHRPRKSKIETLFLNRNAKFIVPLTIGMIIFAFFLFRAWFNDIFPSLPTFTMEILTAAMSPEIASVPSASAPNEWVATEIKTDVIPDAPIPTPTAASSWQQGNIAYVVRNSAKVYFLYTLDLSQETQPQLVLSPDNPKKSRYYAPWFAPDGQLLAYADSYNGKIFVINVDDSTKNPSMIGPCSSPSFAPDGMSIVCDVSEADYFPVYDVQTGTEVNTISLGMRGAVLPAWSPNGKEIAFSIIGENRYTSIWKVGIDGGNPIPLATTAGENYAPSWSPDGQWIAYQSTLNSEKSEVWIMRSDGTGQKQITFSGGGDIWSRGPCFSPDGKWLAFVSNQNETDGPDFGDIFVVSLLTGEVHQITNTGGYVLDWRVTWTK